MGFLDATGVTTLVTQLKGVFSALAHKHSASDVTSGTLPVNRGGTGKGTHTSNSVLTGNGTSAVNNVSTASGALYATSSNGAPQFGTLPVGQGGTGKATHTSNALLTGNGTSAVKNVATANGALYATSANGAAQFGTLPVAQGGTGAATHTSNSILTGNGTSAVKNVATANGALYATSANGAAQFGTLPVAQGGTGGTTAADARDNLDAAEDGGASTYTTLYDAEQAITDVAAAVGDVDVTTDGDLQSQVSTLRDSVGYWKIIRAGWIDLGHASSANIDYTVHCSFSSPVTTGQRDMMRVFVCPDSYSNGFTVAVTNLTVNGFDVVCNALDTWGHAGVYMAITHVTQ